MNLTNQIPTVTMREVGKPAHKDDRNAGYPYAGYDSFPVSYTPIRAGIFNIYLFGEIYDAAQFIGAIEVLQAAGENDVVLIHLSSGGGSLDATDSFLSAMRECEARIIVKASGGCHSAASVILINADEFSLSENFNCLIHNGSVGFGAKYSDWKIQSKHTERYMEGLMRNTYAGFLSDKEIDDLLEGKDLWLDADEFMQRYNLRNEYYKEKIENAQNETLQAILSAAEAFEQAPAKKPSKPRKKKAKQVPDEN